MTFRRGVKLDPSHVTDKRGILHPKKAGPTPPKRSPAPPAKKRGPR